MALHKEIAAYLAQYGTQTAAIREDGPQPSQDSLFLMFLVSFIW